MNGKIFLLQDNNKLIEMNEEGYATEALLQELLATHPDLLAGDQMDSAAPRRWLLVSREMGIPGEEDGADRWSLDHLFLDQDGIPTLIEVKRSSDTRIRREVVGQMLDYAANAIVYLPVEKIRSRFEMECERNEQDPMERLFSFLGTEQKAIEFWQSVETNLQAGRVRMVFVADEIPPQLVRIVEFLNEQMRPAEVLAVEIKHFVGPGMKTLVPRVIGQTAEAEKKKSSAKSNATTWDKDSFFAVLRSRPTREAEVVAQRLYEWIEQQNFKIRWNQAQNGGFYVVVTINDREILPFGVRNGWKNAYVEIELGLLKNLAPFDDSVKRLELVNRLRQIPGVKIDDDKLTKYPSIPLKLLGSEPSFNLFVETMNWVVNELSMSR